jgi:predicted short-subunit dehydrogenase-like oxidoreductase (DUF2520 family)
VSRRLADALGAHVVGIPPGEKARYHAAAVLASNFPLVLAGLAARLLRDAGVAADAADGAVRALLRGAVANLDDRALGPADVAAVLTGPVARGDAGSVARHVAALAADPVTADAYRALSRAAIALLRLGGRDDAVLAPVAAALDGAADGDGGG